MEYGEKALTHIGLSQQEESDRAKVSFSRYAFTRCLLASKVSESSF